MIRSLKTWVVFLATLAAAVQPALAGGRFGGRSFGGNSGRSFRTPSVAPRFNPGQMRQPSLRNSVVPNRPLGGSFRSALPVVTPRNGIVNRGQTSHGARNPIGGSSRPNLTVPGRSGRKPITAGGNLKSPGNRTFSGLAPSRLGDIRRRINDGTLAGVADSRQPGRGNLTLPGTGGLKNVPTTGRREFAPGRGTGLGGNLTAEQELGINRPSLGDISRHQYPAIGNDDPPLGTATVVGEERQPLPANGGADTPDDPPLGTGTGMETREPLPPESGNGTPAPPTPEPEDHRHVDPLPGEQPGDPVTFPPNHPTGGNEDVADLVSIIDAVSGLIGAVSFVSGSFQTGTDAGFADGDFGGVAEPQPVAEPAVTTSSQTMEPVETKELDIELTDLRLVDTGNLQPKTGPRFRLTYRNNGEVEVPKFNVTVLVDSTMKLTKTAEMVTVEAVGLKPGKSQTVDVRLPFEALRMATDKSDKAAPFALLVAILDSDESLDETDEENNVLVFARHEIKWIEKGGSASK